MNGIVYGIKSKTPQLDLLVSKYTATYLTKDGLHIVSKGIKRIKGLVPFPGTLKVLFGKSMVFDGNHNFAY